MNNAEINKAINKMLPKIKRKRDAKGRFIGMSKEEREEREYIINVVRRAKFGLKMTNEESIKRARAFKDNKIKDKNYIPQVEYTQLEKKLIERKLRRLNKEADDIVVEWAKSNPKEFLKLQKGEIKLSSLVQEHIALHQAVGSMTRTNTYRQVIYDGTPATKTTRAKGKMLNYKTGDIRRMIQNRAEAIRENLITAMNLIIYPHLVNIEGAKNDINEAYQKLVYKIQSMSIQEFEKYISKNGDTVVQYVYDNGNPSSALTMLKNLNEHFDIPFNLNDYKAIDNEDKEGLPF